MSDRNMKKPASRRSAVGNGNGRPKAKPGLALLHDVKSITHAHEPMIRQAVEAVRADLDVSTAPVRRRIGF